MEYVAPRVVKAQAIPAAFPGISQTDGVHFRTTSTLAGSDRDYTYVPTMTAAVVTAGTSSGGTAPATPGTIEVTFSSAVTCASASDYVYSNGSIAMSTCTGVGGAGARTQFVLAPANTTVVAAGGGGSTLTYTQASPTTGNATYAVGPVFEPTGDAVATT